MVWQDFVITGTNLLFGFMLIPQIIDVIKNKTSLNLWSCGLTFIGLMTVNVTMATLGLWLSALPICTIAWLILFVLSWRNKKNNPLHRIVKPTKRAKKAMKEQGIKKLGLIDYLRAL